MPYVLIDLEIHECRNRRSSGTPNVEAVDTDLYTIWFVESHKIYDTIEIAREKLADEIDKEELATRRSIKQKHEYLKQLRDKKQCLHS